MRIKVLPKQLNVRSLPSPSGKIVEVLNQNEIHEAKKFNSEWYEIDKGFVSAKFTSVEPIKETINLTLAQRTLSIAKSQIGFSEIPHGSNWGKHVQNYLASVGINFPAAWCMAFVYYCVNEACKEMKINNPIIKTGGVMVQWARIPNDMKSKTPRVGDIFIMNFGKGKGHTGFVSKVEGNIIHTIEGNSNDEGSREGFEVCRKPGGRNISTIIGFIRLP